MKILVISNLFPPNILGGAESFAYELSKTLAKSHEVLVVTTCSDDNTHQYQVTEFENMKVIRFFPKNMYWVYDRSKKPTWKKVLWHLLDYFNFHSYFSIKKIVADFEPDIVHSHNIDGFSGSVWRAATSLNIPVVHTAHDGHLVCPKANFLHSNNKTDCEKQFCKVYRNFHLLNARSIDLFISPSQFLLNIYMQHGMKVKNSCVIENGVLLSTTTHQQKPCAPLKVLFMGQISEHKGIDYLINTIEFFQNKQVEFHIAGKGPEENRVLDLQENNNKVFYHGFVNGGQKVKLLQDSHILLFPSQCFENSPLTILEAFQYGLIVIASNLGGVPELIDSTESGFLFELNQPETIYETISSMLNDPLKRQSLEQMSIDYFQSFKIDDCAKSYETAYLSLLQNH